MFNRFDRLEIHSLMAGIFDPACELLPSMDEGTWQCVAVEGGGFEYCFGPYSAGILHSVSDQIQNLQNCFTNPNKMTSKDDIEGMVSLKFLRPWGQSILFSVVFTPSPSSHIRLTNTVSPVPARLNIWYERFHGTQMEDDCEPLRIQSFLIAWIPMIRSKP